MTDREFAQMLRSVPREKTEAQVIEIGRQHDAERGLWIANQIVHHEPQEARH